MKIIPYAEGYLDNDTAYIWIYGHAVNVTEKRLEPIFPLGFIYPTYDSLYANQPSLTQIGSFGVLKDPPEYGLKSSQTYLDPDIRVHFLVAIKYKYLGGFVYWDVGVQVGDVKQSVQGGPRSITLNRVTQ